MTARVVRDDGTGPSGTPPTGTTSGSSSTRPERTDRQDWLVRPARPGDEPALLALIQALARYEREPDAVRTTTEDLTAALFPSEGPALAHALVAARPGDTGTPESPGRNRPDEVFGMALWFVTFSTWTGRHGIWLEDLFVDPASRGLGAGRALLEGLAAICVQRGYARLDWAVLDWNTPAQDFYRSLDAHPMDDWTSWRLDGPALRALGTTGGGGR